jgi:hypothetical protein
MQTNRAAASPLNTIYSQSDVNQKAEIFSDPKVEEKMEQYCKNTFKGPEKELGAYQERMKGFVQDGEKLAKQIKQGTASIPTKENVRDVTWYLMAMSAAKDQEFTKGTFRISDPDGKLFDFLEKCKGDKRGGCYGRFSSHFQAYTEQPSTLIPAGDKRNQRGLDMGDFEMPGNKRTLLFSKLPDGSTWVKPEEHGFPPFYENGFRSLSNFHEAMRHCMDFVTTRFDKSPKPKDPREAQINAAADQKVGYLPRKEHVEKSTKNTFKNAITKIRGDKLKEGKLTKVSNKFKSIYKTQPERTTEQTRLDEIEKQGVSLGLSEMIDLLKKEIDALGIDPDRDKWMNEATAAPVPKETAAKRSLQISLLAKLGELEARQTELDPNQKTKRQGAEVSLDLPD